MSNKEIKVAIIDLYNNERNEGMRCIKEIVSAQDSLINNTPVRYEVFDTRYKNEIPSTEYDIYISSGGPGSPFEGEGQKWDSDYFKLLDNIWSFNQNNSDRKKYIFFICHSFQMMARYFQFAKVNERYEKSFGVLPFIRTGEGKIDPVLKNLSDPFYAADFRQYQVIEPDKNIIEELGASILAVENPSEVKEHQQAIMAVRISNEIFGTQFHPEADANSMLFHFKQDDRKKQVTDKYGEERYFQMLDLLEKPEAIKLTRKTVLPTFLRIAIEELNTVLI